MNADNNAKIWKFIQEAGDYLKDKLPHSSKHLQGRNSYDHVALCLKNKFGQSYIDLPDQEFKKVIKFIDFLKKNPK